jgi:hypothetical protein
LLQKGAGFEQPKLNYIPAESAAHQHLRNLAGGLWDTSVISTQSQHCSGTGQPFDLDFEKFLAEIRLNETT